MCHDCFKYMYKCAMSACVMCVCVHVCVYVHVCVCMCACVCCVLLTLTGPPVQCTDVLLVIASVNKNLFRQLAILNTTHHFTGGSQKEGICELLYAAAWIVYNYHMPTYHFSDGSGSHDHLATMYTVW